MKTMMQGAVKAEMQRMAEQQENNAPYLPTETDKGLFLESVEPEFYGEANELWDSFDKADIRKKEGWLYAQVLATKDMQRQLLIFSKPVLTVPEAAFLIGLSEKRLSNIIYEEKVRLGRLPDFVCDASGVIQRRILRDALLDWVKGQKRRVGRARTKGGMAA